MYAFIRFFCHLIHIGSLFLFRWERKVRDVKETSTIEEWSPGWVHLSVPTLPAPWKFQTRPTLPVKLKIYPNPALPVRVPYPSGRVGSGCRTLVWACRRRAPITSAEKQTFDSMVRSMGICPWDETSADQLWLAVHGAMGLLFLSIFTYQKRRLHEWNRWMKEALISMEHSWITMVLSQIFRW